MIEKRRGGMTAEEFLDLFEKSANELDVEYSYTLARDLERFRSDPVLGYRTAGSRAEADAGEFLYEKMREIGLKTEKLFNGADFLKAVKDVMDCDDGYGIENVYDIHKRLMFCHLVRVKNDGQGSGVYVFLQD